VSRSGCQARKAEHIAICSNPSLRPETLRRELNERNLDLVIAREGGPFKDDQFEFQTLYDDSFVVLAGAQNPWARRRKIALAELVNEPWALPPPESSVWEAAMEAFRASGLDCPRTTLVTSSPELRISLLATGRFLTIAASALKFRPPRPQGPTC
jgi:DNA-binding transcriptional LysR family regulator